MIKTFLEIGEIVGTHSVHGEMRLNPWCDTPGFVKKFKTLYFDESGNQPVKVISARPHGNVTLLKLEGSWFIAELIGCEAVDADDNAKIYGTVTDVSRTGANDVWHITNESGEYLIPVIPDVVTGTDIAGNKVYIRPLKGIFE